MSKSRRKGPRQEHFDHWPNLRQALIELIAELERFPSPHDLERHGRYDLMRAIVRQGGSIKVAQRLKTETEAATATLTPATGQAEGAAD